MIVDPNTGQPVDANTVTGEIGIGALEAAGADVPLAVDLLASMPAAHHTMMWNMGRSSRTMTKGGRRVGLASRAIGLSDPATVQGYTASRLTRGRSLAPSGGRGFRQTFSPLSWGRLAKVENIDPLPGSKTYTPFNFMARTGNKLATRASKSSTRMGRYIAGHLGPAGETGEWFSAGTMGRLAAMGKVYGASDRRLRKMVPHIRSAFETLNPGAVSHMDMMADLVTNPVMRNEAGQMSVMSMRGSISQKIGGFVHVSEMARSGLSFEDSVYGMSKKSAGYRGALKAENWMAQGGMRGFAARNARFLPAAARAAGPISYILLARDLAAMTGKVLAHAAQTAIDAGNSIKGSLDKPIMGMGFRDNMVASTSRARGVMAIQNSRLNMRSALGNEAAGIHAAWG